MNVLNLPFIFLAGIFLLVLCALCLFGVRRLQLRRALGTIDASINLTSNRWVMGVCRYQATELEWFKLLALTPVPRLKMVRSEIVMVGRREPTEAEITRIPPDSVIVTLHYRGQDVVLAMKFSAYNGLSSWLEAGPVVGIGTWR